MINHIHIKNFKSWADTGQIKLAPLTGFFGTNSSGKTSLLQMLLLLKHTVEATDRNMILNTEGIGTNRGDRSNIVTIPELMHNLRNLMVFEVNWNPNQKNRIPAYLSHDDNQLVRLTPLSLTTSIQHKENNLRVRRLTYTALDLVAEMSAKSDETYDFQIHSEGQKLKKIPKISKNINLHPIKCYSFSSDIQLLYKYVDYLWEFIYLFEQQMQEIYYLGSVRDYPQRIYGWAGEEPYEIGQTGELTIAALAAKGNENIVLDNSEPVTLIEKIRYWLIEMGMVASFEIEPVSPYAYQVKVKRHANSHEVLLPDVGFGVSQVLPVLVMCYYCPPNSTIILEQPEVHLHPAVQSILADVLIDAIKTRNVQIIFESHSEHLLRRLQRRIAEEKITNEDTALYFCDIEDGQSRIEELKIDEYGNIRNYPKDFFGDLTGDLLEMAQSGLKRMLP